MVYHRKCCPSISKGFSPLRPFPIFAAVIFGDFGEYSAEEFLPYQNYRPIITHPDEAGDDYLYGDEDDDFVFGQVR